MPHRPAFVLSGVCGVLMAGVTLALARLGTAGLTGTRLAILLSSLVSLYVLALVCGRLASRGGGLPWAAVLLIGLLMRFPLVVAPPVLSDDIYRYLWDGQVALAGGNPYEHPPEAPGLERLRDRDWQRINNPGLPTIYPPVAQAFFAMTAAVVPGVFGFKAALVLADLLAALLVLRFAARRPENRWKLLLYWWHPLFLVEFAWSGHVDVVGIVFLAAATGLSSETVATGSRQSLRRFRAVVIGLFTGAASLVKFLALPAGPFLAGRRWPAALFGVLLAGLLYFPYLDPGVNVLGSLAEYVARWRSNDFLFALFVVPGTAADQVHRLAQARLLSVVVWALVAVLVILRKPEGPRAALIVLGTAILVAPTIHPWYVAWLVPLLAFEFSPAWFCLTLTVLLAYHPLPGFLAGAGWREIGWVKAIEFGTFSVLAAAEIAAALRRRDGRKAARSRESLPRTEPETV